MNTDIDKYLTEAMGEKVRNVTSEKREFRGLGCIMFLDFVCSCCNGPQSACGNYATDFSTGEGFLKLFEFARGQEWWIGFAKSIAQNGFAKTNDHGGVWLADFIINPDRFANAVYEFLKGRES